WAFPRVAETARLPVRAWNAMRAVLANAAFVVARVGADRVAAPRSAEAAVADHRRLHRARGRVARDRADFGGRYGLVILVTGQLTTLYLLLERWRRTRVLS
ncbi:MAG: hypothetical protein ABI024_03575, partial [Vicinamibacterales bacterium]